MNKSLQGVVEPLERSVSGLHASLVPKLLSQINPTAAVLDVGCGSGAWLDRLAQLGFNDLTGIDQDVDQISTTSGRFIRANIDELNEWPLPDCSYKLITAIEVIEHLTNIGNFLVQSKRFLAPDGYMLITTPNILSIVARIRFFLRADMKQFGLVGDRTHLFPVVLGTFPRVLARYDLKLVEYWGYPLSGRTLTSGPTANFVARLLRLVLPEPVSGDVLCMLVRHAGKL